MALFGLSPDGGYRARRSYLPLRWALTPPFHPCPHWIGLNLSSRWRSLFCGPFQGLLPPGVTRHPPLWSPDFPHREVKTHQPLCATAFQTPFTPKIIYSQHFPISRAYSTSHTYYLFHYNMLTHIFIYLFYTKINKRIFNFVDITKYFQNRHFYTIWFYLKKIVSNQYFPYI